MAYASNVTELNTGLLGRIGQWFMDLGQAFFVARGMEARMVQLQQLQSKSDEELAAMGLKRDELARHVFRDIIYL